jgi:hypothetical protein
LISRKEEELFGFVELTNHSKQRTTMSGVALGAAGFRRLITTCFTTYTIPTLSWVVGNNQMIMDFASDVSTQVIRLVGQKWKRRARE